MQVPGINVVTKRHSTQRTKKVGDSGIFGLEETIEIESDDKEISLSPINSLANLLSLHDLKDRIELEKNNIDYSSRLLSNLDELSNNIAASNDPMDSLNKISKALSVTRSKSENKDLEDIVDQIELRAAIEKAKLQKRLNAK